MTAIALGPADRTLYEAVILIFSACPVRGSNHVEKP